MPGFVCPCLPAGRDYAVASGFTCVIHGEVRWSEAKPNEAGWDPKAYTHHRRPVQLVYAAEFSEITDAIAWEKQVKGWGRKKKEVLIRREYEKLPELAQCKNQTHFKYFQQ